MKRFTTYGPILIILAAFLWGLDGVLRRQLGTLPVTVIVFYEHLIGAILIAPFLFKAWHQERAGISRRDWLALVGISLMSGVVGTILFTAALIKVHFISISVVFLLQKLQPLFATSFAVLVLKEKITGRYLGWALLALLAAYFTTFPGGTVNFATGSGTILAALMALGAAAAWGSSTAFSRYTLQDLSHTLTTGLRFWLTVPLALLAVWLFGNVEALGQLQTEQIELLILIALSTGMVALWIYYKGLQTTQVKVATFLELAFPLTGVAVDLLYYKNSLHLSQYLAATALLFAMYQISQLNTRKNEI